MKNYSMAFDIALAPPSRNVFNAAPCSANKFFHAYFRISSALFIRITHFPNLLSGLYALKKKECALF